MRSKGIYDNGKNHLTVMSYNIQIGIRSAHNPTWDPARIDLDPAINVIRGVNPDIVALQEVDRFRKRSRYEDQVACMADALGMHYAFGPAYFDVETINGRGMYGNALLSKYPIESYFTHALRRRNQRNRDESAWITEPRAMLEAKLNINDRIVYAYSVHLSTTSDQQTYQVTDVMHVLDHVCGPKIVMGDFNAEPHESHMTPLFDKLHSPFKGVKSRATYPNGENARRSIDHIFLSSEIEVKQAEVIDERTGASDHNPVVAQVIY